MPVYFLAVLLLTISVPGIVNANQTKSSDNIISLYVGLIRDVHRDGGWEPTISFHAVSVMVLSTGRLHVQWLINTDSRLVECQWRGRVGTHIICGLYSL
jgi:hypothetical protein